MSSIEELKVIRLYRAFNTIIRLCHNRGYTIRHPSVVATALNDSALYDAAGDGLSYSWFVSHFVTTPHDAKKHATSGDDIGREDNNDDDAAKSVDLSDSRRAQRSGSGNKKMSAEKNKASALHRVSRKSGSEWIVMRGALRLTCTMPSSHGAVNATMEDENKNNSNNDATDNDDVAATSKSMIVFFSPSDALNMNEVVEYREKALQKKAAAMIVVVTRVGPAVRRDVQELSGRLNAVTGKALLSIQLFEEDALAFDVMMHETVQRHRVLSQQEADTLLRTRQLTLSQLPRMLVTDPVVQYLGLSRGDIVNIRRESKESGPYDMFRLVI